MYAKKESLSESLSEDVIEKLKQNESPVRKCNNSFKRHERAYRHNTGFYDRKAKACNFQVNRRF